MVAQKVGRFAIGLNSLLSHHISEQHLPFACSSIDFTLAAIMQESYRSCIWRIIFQMQGWISPSSRQVHCYTDGGMYRNNHTLPSYNRNYLLAVTVTKKLVLYRADAVLIKLPGEPLLSALSAGEAPNSLPWLFPEPPRLSPSRAIVSSTHLHNFQ